MGYGKILFCSTVIMVSGLIGCGPGFRPTASQPADNRFSPPFSALNFSGFSTPVSPVNPVLPASTQSSSAVSSSPADGPSPAQTAQVVTTFITGYYESYLGREPDAGGLQYYVNYVVNGGSIEVVRLSIMNSPEAQIRHMYLVHLLREPDQGGMAYWLNAVASGQTLQQTEDNIRRSTECKVDCIQSASQIAQVATTFIMGYYETYLGRAADAGGLQYYVNYVVNGGSIEVVRLSILNSPEAQIRHMYLVHLLREPDQGGMAYWLNAVASGQTLQQTEDNIRRSTECKVDCIR
jgi:hypothetical protein